MSKDIPRMMCHIECNSQDVLIRVPYDVAKKFAETDAEFAEYFRKASKKYYGRKNTSQA